MKDLDPDVRRKGLSIVEPDARGRKGSPGRTDDMTRNINNVHFTLPPEWDAVVAASSQAEACVSVAGAPDHRPRKVGTTTSSPIALRESADDHTSGEGGLKGGR